MPFLSSLDENHDHVVNVCPFNGKKLLTIYGFVCFFYLKYGCVLRALLLINRSSSIHMCVFGIHITCVFGIHITYKFNFFFKLARFFYP